MPRTGLEPARLFKGHKNLNLACIPVSPPRLIFAYLPFQIRSLSLCSNELRRKARMVCYTNSPYPRKSLYGKWFIANSLKNYIKNSLYMLQVISFLLACARGEIRTPKFLRTQRSEHCASTNFATRAIINYTILVFKVCLRLSRS